MRRSAGQWTEISGSGHSNQLARLRLLIDEREDDLRAYHLPASCTVWSLGAQQWPDGICLSATHAARLLTAHAPVILGEPTEIDPVAEPSA